MNIAFSGSIFFLQRYGGISRYFISLAKNLIQDKENIHIFSPLYKNKFLNEISKNYKTGFYLERYPTPDILKKFINKMSYSNIINSDYEIVHETYYSENFIGLKNKKKVITVYDLIHEKFPELYNNNIFDIKEKVIKSADKIISISEKTKHDLISFYNIKESKIEVVSLGCDHIFCDKNKIDPDLIISKKPFILFVGSRMRYKNFDLLLKAFVSSPKINNQFNIVCFGGEIFSKQEIKKFSNLGLDKKIISYRGSDKILYQLYLKARLFVFPSYYEGFGIPLLEAMILKCPILASNIEIFKEVSKGNVHFFNSNNIEDLKNSLNELLFNERDLNYFVNSAYELAKNFSWSNCSKKTLDVYKSL